MKRVLALAALALSAAPVLADWTEQGDAPALHGGQQTVGVGELSRIIGHLDNDDADMYCIQITDPQLFLATTVAGTTMDTQLFLFSPNDMGVTFNDDSQSTLQSTLTNANVSLPGIYFLAVSAYDLDPRDAAGAEIWADSPFGIERTPDGAGAANPLAAWGGTGFSDPGDYTINLRGATYHVPEPASMALLSLGWVGFAIRRR